MVAAVGQDSNHDDLIEAKFRSMVKKPIAEISPPEPPFMRGLPASNGNNSNNDSSTSEYFKLKRDQVNRSRDGVIKQLASQRIEQEGEEQLRSLQQNINDVDDRSHYYVL